jgi:hypothetical protein
VVWKLDGLNWSLPYLTMIVTGLKTRAILFPHLTEEMDTTMPNGRRVQPRLDFPMSETGLPVDRPVSPVPACYETDLLHVE